MPKPSSTPETDTTLPGDHIDRAGESPSGPRLGVVGWLRWGWRQLTSMRTALILLLMLALAAIPGSLIPQRSSDPNGVIQFDRNNPGWAWAVQLLQLHDVFGSVWFSAVYLLLFASLVGCLIPRIRHHAQALLAQPPATPHNLQRLPAHDGRRVDGPPEDVLRAAEKELRRQHYRLRRLEVGGERSIAAERGYLRETGNLLFHLALLAVLVVLAVGTGYRFTGQRILVEGQTFASTRIAYDSFTPGRFVTDAQIPQFTLTLDRFRVDYVEDNLNALGMPRDFDAQVTVTADGTQQSSSIRVNEPLSVAGTDIYLLGNGYAPTLTVRNPAGDVVFSDSIPFLPQDANLTSLGVVKVPDGLAQQVGMIALFYPTRATAPGGASYSSYPDLLDPVVTLDVYVGDLGLDSGVPVSVYSPDTSAMTQIAGRGTATPALELTPGASTPLPDGLGTIELTNIPRFASLDIAHDPTQAPTLIAAAAAVAGLALSLFVPRRRIWVRAAARGDQTQLEVAALARGDDPRLQSTVDALAARLETAPRPPGGSDDPLP
jgi:cytochrome c biogenesis protein